VASASSKKNSRAKAKHKAPARARHKAPAKAKKPAAKPAPKKPARPEPKLAGKAPAKGSAAKPAAAAPATAPVGHKKIPTPMRPPGAEKKRSSRKSSLSQRRGPDGQLFVPGDLLVPGGPKDADEVQYFFRGCVAAEHAAPDAGIDEVIGKRAGDEAVRPELRKHAEAMMKRFDGGTIEPFLPNRPAGPRRTFQTVVERARHRRREIGAFLRGLDMGRTETSHMDSHGEASLQGLMEWAARLENLVEADEPQQADYGQFHRGLDQLESTTEALIVDVELTLRRLRDRTRAR
jgi:hypothetical protein